MFSEWLGGKADAGCHNVNVDELKGLVYISPFDRGEALALHIRDDEADRLVRNLAAIRKVSLTEAIKLAVRNELERTPLIERIRPIQDEIRSWGSTGLKADKAFYDSLNDE